MVLTSSSPAPVTVPTSPAPTSAPPVTRAPSRDRFVDGLRALAILGVVIGHWLVGALVETDGGLRIDSPLRYLPWLHVATWLLQMLALFFLVGGYTSANGLRRARERGVPDAMWIRRRLWRLGRPVLAASAMLALALPLAAVSGVAPGTLRTTVVLFLQPLWFMGVYAVITVLTPYLLRADARWGLGVPLVSVGVVAAVDLARFGPGGDAVPGWFGYLTVLPAWAFGFQLGVAWARGRLDQRAARWLLTLGAAAFVTLLVVLDYPVSITSVPGATRSNSNPPSLMVPALAAIQIGAAMLLRPRIEHLLRRRAVWLGVAALNLAAMGIFCWHQVALVIVSDLASRTDLATSPEHVSWLVTRLTWYPILALVLAGLVMLTRRWER
ncbi:acyltransferase [Plantactinospora sp. GCM10030261]|uniref:acyltransferase family protein n=1 Tax=Plantactinospora sp. GCM10030261 TaxID=3273420 RepID=UPI00361C77CD